MWFRILVGCVHIVYFKFDQTLKMPEDSNIFLPN